MWEAILHESILKDWDHHVNKISYVVQHTYETDFVRKIGEMKLRLLEREKLEKELGIPTSRKITEQLIEQQTEVLMEEYVASMLGERLEKMAAEINGR